MCSFHELLKYWFGCCFMKESDFFQMGLVRPVQLLTGARRLSNAMALRQRRPTTGGQAGLLHRFSTLWRSS